MSEDRLQRQRMTGEKALKSQIKRSPSAHVRAKGEDSAFDKGSSMI